MHYEFAPRTAMQRLAVLGVLLVGLLICSPLSSGAQNAAPDCGSAYDTTFAAWQNYLASPGIPGESVPMPPVVEDPCYSAILQAQEDAIQQWASALQPTPVAVPLAAQATATLVPPVSPLAATPAPAGCNEAAQVQASPSTVMIGESVNIRGGGFAPLSNVTIQTDDGSSWTVPAGIDCGLLSQWSITDADVGGTHTATVSGQNVNGTTVQVTASFTVISPTPPPSPSPVPTVTPTS